MASELSMNGRKKIETLQKEFTQKFPYLTLVFLDKERRAIDISKSLSEVRQAKGADISIIASLKVNTLEKRFLENYGLVVEVAYQKSDKVVYTKDNVDKTLNELNKWCQENECQPFEFKKSLTGNTLSSVQEQLFEAIKKYYPNAEAKKINKDNYLDIHIPEINNKRGTHLFFNTAKDGIKIGFYCRDEEFVENVLSKSSNIEKYAQGIRILNNPLQNDVEEATAIAFAFIENLSGEVIQKQAAPGKESPKPKKEKPAKASSKKVELTDFDLTEFDLEGRAISSEVASAAPSKKGKPADLSEFDETDRCLDDPMAFLTCIQLVRNYYLMISSESTIYRSEYEETLREYSKAAVVPRITNEQLRLAHEDGNLIESLLLGPMLKAEEIYDKNYDTHNEYVRDLNNIVSDVLSRCNIELYLDTLEFFMYLGDMLDEEDAPSGSLTAQDRYFPLFLMLKASPEQNINNLEVVLNKETKSRNANNGCDVKALLLKASGNYNQLSNEEKLGLVLYDFIIWDEKPGLDIKLGDIAAAQSIFTLVTQNAALGEELVGGFNDNFSFEIFQFFNVEFNREGFHAFYLERWKELSLEWNPLKLQLLLEHIKRDFHPNTYLNNPVLIDYLEVFGGV
jgi:hypothetical protein